ncbi:MAG: hypothetical protein HYS08_04780 [Chlamydiae bacterium]|nr:hypothetical protein [Chlamydiota bacterium]MBI3265797.1 hypothetical protein [Chlamydiota bacterium]
MTKLMEKAFKTASKLPVLDQNILAKWLLEELKSDRKWEEVFADSEYLLDDMADEALEERKKGKVKSLDFNRL